MEENFNQDQERKQWEEFQKYQQDQNNKKSKKKGWLWGCGGSLVLFIVMIIGFAACSIIFTDSDSSDDTSKKTYKVGDTFKKDGVEVTITNVEYASTNSEYAEEPKNGKAIKVNFKFKNNNDDQVLFQDPDFTAKVDNKNYEEWFGTDDNHAGFSHQLNKGNTATGYIYYDVPNAKKYTIEMNATPNIDTLKAKWEVNSSEIK